jgi:hypothetical protein
LTNIKKETKKCRNRWRWSCSERHGEGQRRAATGEVCVSRWRYRRPDDPDPDLSKAPAFIEIVTGSEAEWLIFALQCLLTAEADAQGLTFEEFVAGVKLEGTGRMADLASKAEGICIYSADFDTGTPSCACRVS